MNRRRRGAPRQYTLPPGPLTGTHRQVSWAREIYRRLLDDYTRILENCDILALLTDDMTGKSLAEWYIRHLSRRQRRAVWWIHHRSELSSAWFMGDYIRKNLHIFGPEPSPHFLETQVRYEALLCPADPKYPGAVDLITEPDSESSPYGLCLIKYEQNSAFIELANLLGMKWSAARRAYIREITGTSAPLIDRCAEIGSRLLLAGFRIMVLDEEIRTAICTGRFGWEHGRWVLTGSSPTRLRLVFPRDRELFQRVRRMGAYWNGRHIEVGVWHTDAILDLARLYKFRITQLALDQMLRWQEMSLNGVCVCPQPPDEESISGDPIRQILEGDDSIPEDLIDED